MTALPTDGTVTLANGAAVTVGQSLSAADLVGLFFTPTPGIGTATSDFVYQVTDPANLVNTGDVVLAIGEGTPQITTGGQIPNTPTPTIKGTALPGTLVTLLANGVAIGTAVADATTGDYSVTASKDLSLGLNRLVTTSVLPDGVLAASAPLVVFDVQSPSASGVSTTDFSSADIGNALGLGAKLAFIDGTQSVQLTDGTLSVGADTQEASIQRLYVGLLGRASDAGGITFYDQLATNGVSTSQIAHDIMQSPEYIAAQSGVSNADFVATLYHNALGRDAALDPQGASYWTNLLGQGASRADVAVGISGAQEAKATLAPQTTDLFVSHDPGKLGHLLYETGLGREIELNALSSYQQSFDALSPTQFADDVASSAEFQQLHAGQNNAQYVQSLYQAGLGRAADASGLSFYAGQLNSGNASRGGVLLDIASSNEATAHLTAALNH